ncbi:MAG: hypothetical protein ACRDR6_00525 [Pseudonocardiaceae bacterium]
MDFWQTMLIVFRRWYVALPVFLLAFAAAGAVYISRPVHYVSDSILLLTTPTAGATQNFVLDHAPYRTNPLLNFGQGLNNTAAVLAQKLTTPEMFDQLGVSPNGDPTFGVTNGSDNPELLISSPLVVITAQGTSPGKTRALVTQVTHRARQELVELQQNLQAPPSTYVVLSEVISPTIPQTQLSTRLRPAVAALALGCAASVAAVFGAESIMTHAAGTVAFDHDRHV